MENIIFELGIVLISSACVGSILYFLKQPLILAFIIAGVLIGPVGFSWVQNIEFIHGVSAVGIMLMLFLVGLEMNIQRLRDLGLVSLISGIGQVLFTGVFGFLLVKLFGFTIIQSMYLAVALTFSSTVIAVKIMSDKKESKSLYGHICIGILIVQDILAIMALFLLAGFKEGSFSFDINHFSLILIKGVILGLITILIAQKILNHLYAKIATSHELLILFSLSWCFLISILSMQIGFSMEIGAFIAGVSLANLPYTHEINAKTKVLRDFFITIFFVALGAGMVFASIGNLFLILIALILFVVIGNPIIILLLMGLLGYDKRTSFFTGLSIANISEFSLIVIALGSKLGHLNEQISSMVAIIAIVTMILSSYMMTYNEFLYKVLKKYLTIFEIGKKKNIAPKKAKFSNHIILFGCGDIGEQVLEQILAIKEDYVTVDYDNQVIKELIKKNINCVFGDIEDEDLLDSLDIEYAEVIISTVSNTEDNYRLLQYVKNIDHDKRPIVIATANSAREGLSLFNKGVDYVVLKPYLGANHIHSINKELYEIEEEIHHKKVFSITNELLNNQNEDCNIAKIIQSLNQLRMKEIKDKIKQKKIKLLSKKFSHSKIIVF